MTILAKKKHEGEDFVPHISQAVDALQRHPRLWSWIIQTDVAIRTLCQTRPAFRYALTVVLVLIGFLPVLIVTLPLYIVNIAVDNGVFLAELPTSAWFTVPLSLIVTVVLLSFLRYLLPFFEFTIGSCFSARVFRWLKIFHYYSPMLIVERNFWKWGERYTRYLHDGTLFDYWRNINWNEGGEVARNQIVIWYLQGLLAIAKDIERGELPTNLTFIATSYFFSARTMRRFGFSIQEPSAADRQHFHHSYYSLLAKKIYIGGGYPDLSTIKTAEISGSALCDHAGEIRAALELVERRMAPLKED